MKISQLALSIVLLLIGGAAVMYSADQQKVMELLVATHGGGQQVDASSATGLRKLNADLESEYSQVSVARTAALKEAEAARVEMRDRRDKRDDAAKQYEANQAQLDGVRSKVTAMNQSVEKLRLSFNEALGQLKAYESAGVAASENFIEVVESIKSVVEREDKRAEQLAQQLEENRMLREAASKSLAKESAELKRLNEINDRFFRDYSKNGDEYQLLAADTTWRFVVFNAGEEHGMIPGDATPLLLKRGADVVAPLRVVSVTGGMVIAEFDPKDLKGGMVPQPGDTVFRVKPLGH